MITTIDENFNQHAKKVPALIDDMIVMELSNVTSVDSGLNCDTFNIVHVKSNGPEQVDHLQESLDHFSNTNKEFCIWVNKENLTTKLKAFLESKGLKVQNEEVGMVLSMDNYDSVLNDLHQNVKPVVNDIMLKDYADVIAKNWSPPDQNVIKYYQLASEHYLDQQSGITLLVYYHEGKPISTVELFESNNKMIGLYGFASLEGYRGQGIGTALFTYALNLIKEKGFRYALLQATEDGIGIYKKYGFQAYTKYFEYA